MSQFYMKNKYTCTCSAMFTTIYTWMHVNMALLRGAYLKSLGLKKVSKWTFFVFVLRRAAFSCIGFHFQSFLDCFCSYFQKHVNKLRWRVNFSCSAHCLYGGTVEHSTTVSSVREMTKERNLDICRHLSLRTWAGGRGNLEIQKYRKILQEIHL